MTVPAGPKQVSESLYRLLANRGVLIYRCAHSSLCGDLDPTHRVSALYPHGPAAPSRAGAGIGADEAVELGSALLQLLYNCSLLLSGGAYQLVSKVKVAIIAQS